MEATGECWKEPKFGRLLGGRRSHGGSYDNDW